MKSKLSIIGIYEHDDTVFNGLQLPAEMSRNILIDFIYMECSDLELLYPEPSVMKKLISSWSVSRLHSWERLYESTVQEYNMIHNFDRYEEWTDNANRDNTTAVSNSRQGNSSGTVQNTISKPGYNSTNYVTVEQNRTDSSNYVSDNGNANSTEKDVSLALHKGHLYGNIGVTTAAQMIQGERDIDAYNVYMAITQEFKERFCVLVY